MDKIKITGIAILLGLFVFNSCKNEYDEALEDEEIKIKEYLQENNYTNAQKTESGLYYIELKEGTGALIGSYDFISLNLNGTTIENDLDPELTDSNVTFIVDNNPMIEGINEGVKLMKQGGKGRFIIPFNLSYYSPNTIESNFNTYVFEVEINEIIEDTESWERERIDNYLANDIDTNLTVEQDTVTGFCFIPTKIGTGDSAKYGHAVYVKYTGSLLNGFVFDDTYSKTAYNAVLDTTNLINGFVKGILKMQEGGEAIIIIPYSLAYGSEYVRSVIPSYATLVFDIELDSVD